MTMLTQMDVCDDDDDAGDASDDADDNDDDFVVVAVAVAVVVAAAVPARSAQGGNGSVKDRKPIGEVDCCESWLADQSH